MEIERKFILRDIPNDLNSYNRKEIEQGYLCKGPVIRIRKSNSDYILTYKSKPEFILEEEVSAKHSNELEVPLTEEAYLHLKEKIDGYIIEKTRYLIPLNDKLTVELDVFKGRLEGLIFAEVEFDSEESSKRFQVPEWFGEDVTFDPRFKNSYLSTVESMKEWGKNLF